MGWLTDQVALITGGGSGIGEAVVRRFVEEGARVVVLDLSYERAKALEDELGERIAAVHGDVRSWEDNQGAVAVAVSRWGRLDVFVGNAGIHDGSRRLADLSPQQIRDGLDQIVAVNVRAYLLGAKAALAELRKTRGNIIFTLSTSSFFVGGGGAALYVASKHAALGVMRALANELAPEVRVNGVAPAGTPTNIAVAPALVGAVAGASTATEAGAARRSVNLLGISLQPDDHAGAYVLLASSQARAITGTVIGTDAGRGVSPAAPVANTSG